jgi:hypothetical protein
LKLDIKPVTAGPHQKDLLRFSLNFHRDVAHLAQEERVKRIIQYLESWSAFRTYARKLVDVGSRLGRDEQ